MSSPGEWTPSCFGIALPVAGCAARSFTIPSGRPTCRLETTSEPAEIQSARYAVTNRRITMCNLYSITTNQAAIIALFRVMNR
jgi:hypothetical protein